MEGEGCFTMENHRKNPYPVVALKMCDEDIVKRFKEFCEEHYNTTTRLLSYVPSNPKHSTHYHYRVNGPKALALMNDLYPYMGERRRKRIDDIRNNCN